MLSAQEKLMIGYNNSLTAGEKLEAVQQLEARKKAQEAEYTPEVGNMFMTLQSAYGESKNRREERAEQERLNAKMERLAELEAKSAAANQEFVRKQKLEADMQRLQHLEQADKAGLL